MTPDQRDELASALLDGVLPADQADAARRDAAVVARLAELEAARELLRSVPPPEPTARVRALAAAKAAFDEDGGAAIAAAPGVVRDVRDALLPGRPPAPVADVTHHRRARRSGTRWLGAAAAAILVLVGVVSLAVVGGGGSHEDEAATTAAPNDVAESADDSAGTEAEASEQGGAAPGAGDRSLGAPGAPVDMGDLGTFSSAAALVARVEAVRDREAASRTADAPASSPEPSDGAASEGADDSGSQTTIAELSALSLCPASGWPPALRDAAAIRLHGRATVDGTEVDVWVVEPVRDDGDGRDRVVALDETCAAVVDQPVP
jgi:hypothetical protein